MMGGRLLKQTPRLAGAHNRPAAWRDDVQAHGIVAARCYRSYVYYHRSRAQREKQDVGMLGLAKPPWNQDGSAVEIGCLYRYVGLVEGGTCQLLHCSKNAPAWCWFTGFGSACDSLERAKVSAAAGALSNSKNECDPPRRQDSGKSDLSPVCCSAPPAHRICMHPPPHKIQTFSYRTSVASCYFWRISGRRGHPAASCRNCTFVFHETRRASLDLRIT